MLRGYTITAPKPMTEVRDLYSKLCIKRGGLGSIIFFFNFLIFVTTTGEEEGGGRFRFSLLQAPEM